MTEGAQANDHTVRVAKNRVVLRDLNERLKAYPASKGSTVHESKPGLVLLVDRG